MTLVRVLAVLALCLMLQTGLGLLAPWAMRWVDLMLVPVVWFAIAHSQRFGMLVGCAAGLLEDAWFHAGVFGLNGFKLTLLGWALGGLGARFDLNQPAGRFAAGALLSLADELLDLGLRQMLDLETVIPHAPTLLIRSLTTGLLVAGAFLIVERASGKLLRRRTQAPFLQG